LKRQKEAAARVRQHRNGHLGHAPSSHRGSVSGGITVSNNQNPSNKVGPKPNASPQQVKKPETWPPGSGSGSGSSNSASGSGISSSSSSSNNQNPSNKVGAKPIAIASLQKEAKKPETWLKANTNSAYGEKPAHIAVGGPMSGLSIMQ
jgi:hypothetical protein